MTTESQTSGQQSPLIHDMLIHLFLYRWRLPLTFVWFATSIVTAGIFALLALITGNMKPSSPGEIGFINDCSLFNSVLLGVPATCLFYCLVPQYIEDCIIQLHRRGVIGDLRKGNSPSPSTGYDFITFLGDLSRSVSSPRLLVASLMASGAFMVIAVPQHMQSKTWVVTHLISLIVTECFWFVMFTLAFLLVFRLVVGIWWINQAFKRFRVIVRPLYPDGVGGLRPLSQFSLRLGSLLFICGVQLGTNQFTTHYVRTHSIVGMEWSPDIVVPWILYLLLAPFAFFAPLAAAHDGMQEAKVAELLALSDQFEERYKALRDGLSGEVMAMKDNADRMSEIRKLYDLANAFPVWPFQFSKFAQFSATVLSPLLLTAATSTIGAVVAKCFGK